MTSRWPYWCFKPNLWEFKTLVLCKRFLSFEINLHRGWPREWILSLVFPFPRRQELLDCVTHIRLLAWLLHGSLSHFVHSRNPHVNCHPIKFEENTHIADYVLIILFSFAEQLKVRVLPHQIELTPRFVAIGRGRTPHHRSFQLYWEPKIRRWRHGGSVALKSEFAVFQSSSWLFWLIYYVKRSRTLLKLNF